MNNSKRSASDDAEANKMRSIITKQRANGCFPAEVMTSLNSRFSVGKIAGLIPEALKNIPLQIMIDIIVTVGVCQYLESKFNHLKNQWELVVRKSIRFITSYLEKTNSSLSSSEVRFYCSSLIKSM
eukprot:TRINITY_DN5541_c0_g1_i1.p1 TRINITY_DN5541_c0_g1~~TRINITY_DN5541_c0_g1_i1.p1  ORF type:complete len:134 (+),score=25.29 TRINITY_DN5541_c0_g1_i1:27-404(+)